MTTGWRAPTPLLVTVTVSTALVSSAPLVLTPCTRNGLGPANNGTAIDHAVTDVQLIGCDTPFTSMNRTARGALPVRVTMVLDVPKLLPPLLVIANATFGTAPFTCAVTMPTRCEMNDRCAEKFCPGSNRP